MTEGSSDWQWWSMGNQTAGVDYAATHPVPAGYSVSQPYYNDQGTLVVTAFPELAALLDLLRELTSKTWVINIAESPPGGIAEDDPGWEWWSMGNQQAGVDYATAHPAPAGWTVSAPFYNEAGALVVSATYTG